jgi:hypothetical protein
MALQLSRPCGLPEYERAAIGPLEFACRRVVRLHRIEGIFRPLAEFGSLPVSCLQRGARIYLVIDHRLHPGGLMRLEYWARLGDCDVPLRALLVLSDGVEGIPETRPSVGSVR